jgi:hypothetical protein
VVSLSVRCFLFCILSPSRFLTIILCFHYYFIYRQEHVNEILNLISKSFDDFSVTADGTPTHAEHFCCMLRMVTKEWKIAEIVIRCRAYQSSFNAKTLAGEVLFILEEEYNLKLEHWRCFMADRASVNGAAIRLVVEKTRLNVLEVPCVSHGLCNAGKKYHCPHMTYVLQKMNTMLKFKMSKSRDLFREEFKEEPLKGGGVRWFQDWEQGCQYDKLGLDNIADYVASCREKGYSPKTSVKLGDFLCCPMQGAKALVEMAAATDAGRRLVQLTYLAESKAPMIFVFYPLINQLLEDLRQEKQPFDRLELACTMADTVIEGTILMDMEIEADEASAELQEKKGLLEQAEKVVRKKMKELERMRAQVER